MHHSVSLGSWARSREAICYAKNLRSCSKLRTSPIQLRQIWSGGVKGVFNKKIQNPKHSRDIRNYCVVHMYGPIKHDSYITRSCHLQSQSIVVNRYRNSSFGMLKTGLHQNLFWYQNAFWSWSEYRGQFQNKTDSFKCWIFTSSHYTNSIESGTLNMETCHSEVVRIDSDIRNHSESFRIDSEAVP